MTLWCLDLKSPWRARRQSARPCLCYIAWRLEKRYKNEDSFWWCLWNGFVCLLGEAEIVWNWCFLGIRLDDCWTGSMAHVWGSDGPWTSRVAAADATSSSKRGRDRWLKLAIHRSLKFLKSNKTVGMKWNWYRINLGVLVERQHNSYASQNDRCWSVPQPAMVSLRCSCFAPRFGCTGQGLLVFFGRRMWKLFRPNFRTSMVQESSNKKMETFLCFLWIPSDLGTWTVWLPQEPQLQQPYVASPAVLMTEHAML